VPRDRPRLWESFKRALGFPRENASEPEIAQPPTDEAPPFLALDETSGVPPAAESAPVRAQTDPIVPAPEAGAEEIDATVAEAPDGRPTPAPPAPEVAAPRSARLARGLASFSRDNADRGKKFRHILDDGDAGGRKNR